MTTIDFGDQVLSLDFANPATAKSFNRSFHKLMPSGIYQGLTIDISSNTEIQVNPGIMYITNKTLALPLSIRIELTTADALTVSSANKYVIARFDWQDLANWYAQVTTVSYASILPTDIILGTLVYDGSSLVAIDYTRKSDNIITDLTTRKDNLKVLPSTAPDANVTVTSGTAYINGTYVSYAGGTLALSSVTSGMITLITLDSSGTLAKVDSSDTGSPTQPDFPVGKLVLAVITRIGATSIVTGDQIVNLIFDKVSGSKTLRSDTLIIAASNSSAQDKLSADYICTGTNDQIIINSAINILNGEVGGVLKLLSGTFIIGNVIVPKSNVSIKGSGNTIIKIASAMLNVLSTSDLISNFYMQDIIIDGNNYSYVGTPIVINNSDGHNNISSNISYDNITIKNFIGTTGCIGFQYQNNLYNCKIINFNSPTGSATEIIGFHYCNNLFDCVLDSISSTTSNWFFGFKYCNIIESCYGQSLTSSDSSNTFYLFRYCNQLNNCFIYNNNFGLSYYKIFANSNQLNNCKILNITTNNAGESDGMVACKVVTNCWIEGCLNSGGIARGISGVSGMVCNYLFGNTTASNSAYADHAGSVTAADTAAGGFNKMS